MRRFFSWLWRFLTRRRAAPRPARVPPPRPLGFEGLEDRRMFSVTAAPLLPPGVPGPISDFAVRLAPPDSPPATAATAAGKLPGLPGSLSGASISVLAEANAAWAPGAVTTGSGASSGSQETSGNQAGPQGLQGGAPGNSPGPAGNQPAGTGGGSEQTNEGTGPITSPGGFRAWAEPRRDEAAPENGGPFFPRPTDAGRPETLSGEPSAAAAAAPPGGGHASDGDEPPGRNVTGGAVAGDASSPRTRTPPGAPGPGDLTTGLFELPGAGLAPAGDLLGNLVAGHGLAPVPPGQGRVRLAVPAAPLAGAPAEARHWSVADLGQILAQAFYLGNLKPAGAHPDPQAVAALLQAPGDTRLLVADLIQRSTEALTRLVQAFYVHFLGRAAAAGEESGWVAMLLSGQTEEQVLSAFLSTAEFYTRAGGLVPAGTGDERFIRALYDLLLQRPAGDAEVGGWLGALPALGRGGVASALLTSVEYRSRRIETYYRELLRRPAGTAAVASWASSPFDLLTIRLFFESHPDLLRNP